MASGTVVGDGEQGRPKWDEHTKFYTRKKFKKSEKDKDNNNTHQSSTQALVHRTSSQQPLPTCSDDPSTPRDVLVVPNGHGHGPIITDNGSVRQVVSRIENRVKIDLEAGSKEELRELRWKLESELDSVRNSLKKLEDKEIEINGLSQFDEYNNSQPEVNETSGLGEHHDPPIEVNEIPEMGGHDNSQNEANEISGFDGYNNSQIEPHEVSGFGGYSNSQVEVNGLSGFGGYSNHQVSANGLAENGGLRRVHTEVGSIGIPRDSRPYQHLRVSIMDHGGGDFVEREKRTPKANPFYRSSEFILGKDKFPPPETKKLKTNGFGIDKHSSRALKNCANLLAKLMKHKHGWVFNTPVDVKGLGLHDYYTIIKHPMDLGTVKARLHKNWYKSPREFAEDVRLTFRNAMTYNPEGQDVHIMAEQLLVMFEEKWEVIEAEYNLDWRSEMVREAGLPTPTSRKTPLPPYPSETRALDRSASMKLSNFAPTPRTPAPKKPKAKDPNKRDMSFDEKQKLSTNLQLLPPEKLENIVQIIKKRNTEFNQQDDEIEVEIDSVDTETLWELDRFVSNYKKSLSKNKRKAELAKAREEAARALQQTNASQANAEAPKETDRVNVSNSAPIQGEKQGDNASISSSSSSSSSDSGSSSSDSDSDSSSTRGSDAGQSPKT